MSAPAEHPTVQDATDPPVPAPAPTSPREPSAGTVSRRRRLPPWLVRWLASRAVVPSAARAKELSLTFLICSLMMAGSFVMVVWNLQDSSIANANTGSRYATIESLVDYSTYWIDQSQYVRTIDKYQVNGHYISSKPPVLPTLGAGVYWLYEHATGRNIRHYEGEVVRLVSLCARTGAS